MKTPALVKVGYFKAPANDKIRPHTIQDGFEYVELITAGCTRFELDRKVLEFGCGAMFWHVGGECTIHKNDPENPYECLCLLFKMSPAAQRRKTQRVTAWEHKDEAVNFSNLMINAFHNRLFDRRSMSCYAYAKIFWEASSFSVRKPGMSLPSSMEKFMEKVNSGFSSGMTTEDMARISGISVPHMHFLTKKYFNSSPHMILLERRLSEAKRLILTGGESIKKISYDCGFMNIETFYRAFSKKYKVTPGLLRKETEPKHILN